MKETSYNKKGTFNTSMLDATYIFFIAPKSLEANELGALFYLSNNVNIKINRSRIMKKK